MRLGAAVADWVLEATPCGIRLEGRGGRAGLRNGEIHESGDRVKNVR